jgi:hypothetical protein
VRRPPIRLLLSLLLLACSPLAGDAQVARSVNGPYTHIWAGAEYSNFKPDWGLIRLPGLTAFTQIAFPGRYGLEGEARFFNFTKPDGLTEKSFLGGPYVRALRYNRLSLNARFLVGIGLVTYTSEIGYGSYFDYAPGANLEYRLARKWKARVDYEYQYMPSAPNLGPDFPPSHGMHPRGFSAGLAYRVF